MGRVWFIGLSCRHEANGLGLVLIGGLGSLDYGDVQRMDPGRLAWLGLGTLSAKTPPKVRLSSETLLDISTLAMVDPMADE